MVFAKALDQVVIVNAAYRLSLTMMRRAKTIFAKHHNQSFAERKAGSVESERVNADGAVRGADGDLAVS